MVSLQVLKFIIIACKPKLRLTGTNSKGQDVLQDLTEKRLFKIDDVLRKIGYTSTLIH
ncbi:MAG: hypothetical protein QXF61_07330 [Nitrososphaeria archaeon]